MEKTTTKTTHNLPRTILHYIVYSRSREQESPYKRSWKNKAEAEKIHRKTKPGKVENNQKEKERIEEELQFLEQHLQEGRQVVPFIRDPTLEFGGTSENVYAGMDEEFRRYQPAILNLV